MPQKSFPVATIFRDLRRYFFGKHVKIIIGYIIYYPIIFNPARGVNIFRYFDLKN